MSENDHFGRMVAEFIKREICPLTDEKCHEVVNRYDEHESSLKLVDELFDYLIKCDSDKCKMGEPRIKKELITFIKRVGKNHEGLRANKK